MILEKHLVSKYNILSQLLPTAAITASMLVIARMMIIRPRSLLQHKKLTNIKTEKIKEREKHHQNLRHQIQRILHPQKIHSKKVTLLKATDFKLSLNLGATNGSFLMKCQIMSITSLSVLFQKRMKKRIYNPSLRMSRGVKKLDDSVKSIIRQSAQVLNQDANMEKSQQKILDVLGPVSRF